MGLGVVGLEAEGLSKAGRRLVEPALPRQRDAQVVVGLGVLRLEAEGLLSGSASRQSQDRRPDLVDRPAPPGEESRG